MSISHAQHSFLFPLSNTFPYGDDAPDMRIEERVGIDHNDHSQPSKCAPSQKQMKFGGASPSSSTSPEPKVGAPQLRALVTTAEVLQTTFTIHRKVDIEGGGVTVRWMYSIARAEAGDMAGVGAGATLMVVVGDEE